MTRLWRHVALGALIPLALLVLWHWAAQNDSGMIPSVGSVLDIALHPARTPNTIDVPPLWFSIQASLGRVVFGFLCASIIGIPLGLYIGRCEYARAIIYPAAHMMWVVSPIAWIPVAILLLGITPLSDLMYGELDGWRHPLLYEIQPAMVLIVAWGAFFPILVASASGAASVKKSHLETVKLMGAGPWFRIRHVILPHSLPAIVNGMRVGLGMAWRVIIAAELYPGTRSGLGHTIEVSLTDNLQHDFAFAAVLYIMVIGLVLSGSLWFLEQRVGHWKTVQS